MNELSLFSGIGGGLLGSLLLGWHTVAAVDFEPYCCEVLARRKQDGIFKEPFDIYCMDIGEFNRRVASIYQGQVDIITGGFPCQPFSVAGRKQGANDARNGFPVLAETIRIIRPRYLLLENVPALLGFDYWGEILSTLSESGYDVRWKVISAGELGAPHRRDRLWIMAFANGARSNGWEYESRDVRGFIKDKQTYYKAQGSSEVGDTTPQRPQERCELQSRMSPIGITGTSQDVSDTTGAGLERQVTEGESRQRDGLFTQRCTWWDKDPADDPITGLDRVAHGVPSRLDRLKGIGNGQVPFCLATAFRYLSGIN